MHELGLVLNVCYRHKADMLNALTNDRFWGQSGHAAYSSVCPRMTQSRHEAREPPAFV